MRKSIFMVILLTFILVCSCRIENQDSGIPTPRPTPRPMPVLVQSHSPNPVVSSGGIPLFAAIPALTAPLNIPAAADLAANEIIAADGTSAEIQAACNTIASLGGGTVYIPAGDFQLDATIAIPGGINLIGERMDRTILRAYERAAVDVNHGGTQPGSCRISGITFIGNDPENSTNNPAQEAILLYNIEDFRIDHCAVLSFKYCINIRSPYNRPTFPQSKGVIDHCYVINYSLWESMYGVADSRVWIAELDNLLGLENATFVENCFFENCSHPTDAFGGGHYVLRNSFMFNSVSIGGHGPGYDSSGYGTRCTEIYNNDIVNSEDYDHNKRWVALGIRGGGGVVFGNNIVYHRNGIMMQLDHPALGDPAFVPLIGAFAHPLEGQVHERWYWDNAMDVTESEILINGAHSAEYIQQDRDYFLRAPTLAADGFTYSPYTYPHPLTNGDDSALPIPDYADIL